MTNIFKFLLTGLLVLLFSCNLEPSISDLHFDKEYKCAYLNNKPFDGTIWSKDNKRMSIYCKNGVIEKINVFHDSGNIAISSTCFFELGRFYDVSGKEISLDDFMMTYPLIVEDIATITDDIINKTN